MKLSHPAEFQRLGGSTLSAYAHPLRRFDDLEGFPPDLSGDQRKRRPSESSPGLRLSFSVPEQLPPGKSWQLSWDSRLYSTCEPGKSRYPEVCHSPGFVHLQGFSPSWRLALPQTYPALFRARSALEVHPTRSFPSNEPHFSRSRCSLVV
jgi:hypothetical protein